MSVGATFTKKERIVSRRLTEELFSGKNSHAMTAFPLRAVFLHAPLGEGEAPVQVLVSVPKRKLRHAVDRNRAKRQIREAFRLNKEALSETLTARALSVKLSFVWISPTLQPSSLVETKVKELLRRINERMEGLKN